MEKIEVQASSLLASQPIVNDFSIAFGTINGSGSQTANTTLLRALFRMGIPVSGKNIFPSNIQGQPTWYTIRLSKDGFLARRETTEIVVSMNQATLTQDMERLLPGGVLFYPDELRQILIREDIVAYPMPVKKLSKESDVPPNLRDYIANMVYVGVVAEMLGIDLDKIHEALVFHFKGKQKPVDSNFNVVKAAAEWSAANLEKRDPYRVEPMEATQGCILTDGNTAAALGAIYGGIQFAAWYPITPASSLAEALNDYLPILRKDPVTGKATYAVVQAEDELAAIGMAIGAGWAGLRSMTSTSGPGLSLMTEYAGLAYYAEVPLVIWDVQRVGPSTGLPTRTAQGDLTVVKSLGHGDSQHVILLPATVSECFEFGWKAFDIAEHLQTPVFVLSDLDLGMNEWMSPPFDYPDRPMDRGKVLWEKDIEKLGCDWGRYKDIDGDGIPYRTIPGNRHPKSAYFARGTGHDENAHYSEDPEIWEKNLARLVQKFQTAKNVVPPPYLDLVQGAEVGIITFGSAEPAVIEARALLANAGIKSDYMRIRAIPFPDDVEVFLRKHDRNYVVEMNRDGQLNQILCQEIPDKAASLISIAHLDGLPLTAGWVENAIRSYEEEK
ncbi:MAG: 2-oxoacid:acceptor oxidoreductase subunit alpha [Chloroflexi bacterium]|nr:2-oxoacid:acceptor oxidoreductase subunit alpha [Chloroflexota bacterium]